MSASADAAHCHWCGGPLGADEEICEDCRLKAIREEERQSEADHDFLEGEVRRLEDLEERLRLLQEDRDEELPVCPRCYVEYQAASDRCSECAVDLVRHGQALESITAEMDRLREELRRGGRRNWIGVYQSQDVFAVIAVVRRLESANIPAMVQSGGFNGSVLESLFPGTPNIQRYRQTVMVPVEREMQAREQIDAWSLAGGARESADVESLLAYLSELEPDPNRKQVHCPACLLAFARPLHACTQCGYEPLLLAEELEALLKRLQAADES